MRRITYLARLALLVVPFAVLAPGSLIVGCGKPPAKAPNPTKPVAERRALDIIAKAVRKNKLGPGEGRDVRTAIGTVHVDVAIDGHKFGIAYQTDNDRPEDDESPLAKKKYNGKLLLAEGIGKEEGAKILVLADGDYLYDDQVGEEHEQTAITAENAIERDVTDFLVQAKTKKWE